MHWTSVAQNWNHMCAECHSTNVEKNYDLASDTYRTTFSEIDVGCEACHGPGSIHVELAESFSPFWDRNRGYGLAKLKGPNPTNQLQTCAPCHSRRSGVHGDFRPGDHYLDHYDLTLLLPGLYHANGQIQDEVYEYGSFLQSKMHAKDVRCTDCHEPHSIKLKFEGNRLCGQCHQPGTYDTPVHHHHPAGSAGAQCVACHMPARTYMEIDSRRDHQFAAPRPDLSVELGTPNACNDCHTKPEEAAAWAAEQVRLWQAGRQVPVPEKPHFAHAIAAARDRLPEAEKLLVEVIRRRDLPAIVRATGVALLGGYDGRASEYERSKAVKDPEPLVRLAAVQAFPARDAEVTWDRLSPLLADPIRAIRVAAAWRLADFAVRDLNDEDSQLLAKALEEYREAQELALDRAASHINLGGLAERLANLDDAAVHYRDAIRLEPYLAGPRAQLARLLDVEIERLAQSGAPAKRLLEIRDEARKLRNEEVELLGRDVQLVEDAPLAWYRYGLMLYLVDRHDEAAKALARACELDTGSYEFRLALTLLYEKQKEWTKAIDSAETLVRLRPQSPEAEAVLRQVRQAAAAGRGE
jgi:tetratricopeptide (TPR) repeat protein